MATAIARGMPPRARASPADRRTAFHALMSTYPRLLLRRSGARHPTTLSLARSLRRKKLSATRAQDPRIGQLMQKNAVRTRRPRTQQGRPATDDIRRHGRASALAMRSRLRRHPTWAPRETSGGGQPADPRQRLVDVVGRHVEVGDGAVASAARSRSPARRAARSARPRARGPAPRTSTMLVSRRRARPRARSTARSASPRRRACAWSSARRVTLCSSAYSPAAARTPACRMPPPSILRKRCSAVDDRARCRRPAEPTGAPRPFEKQTLTVSNGAAQRATAMPARHRGVQDPRAVEVQLEAALARRARDAGEHLPREDPAARALCVFSTATRRRRRIVVVGAA